MKRFAWDSGETHDFRKKLVQNLGKNAIRRNSANRAPVKGGFGGSKYDFFNVMHGSIYADILCIALAHNVRCNIYKTEVISDESKTLRGDPTRRYRQAERCRGAFCWASLLPPRLYGIASIEHIVQWGVYDPPFFLELSFAVVVYRKLPNERLFYNDIRVRKERASHFFLWFKL